MESRKQTLKLYTFNYAALMILLLLTLGLAFVPLGGANTPMGLLIAAVKAYLVAYFFMHLKHEGTVTRIYSLAGLGWLLILLSLSLSDYLSRHWMLLPGPWPVSPPAP